jgi:hypothetical protein
VQQIAERLARFLGDESAEGRVGAETVLDEARFGEMLGPGIAERDQVGTELLGHAGDGLGVLAPDRANGDGHGYGYRALGWAAL